MAATLAIRAQNLLVEQTPARWRWRLFCDALVALAAEPSDQLERLGSAHPDELGLDFDNAKRVVETLRVDGVNFSPEAIDLLETLDAELFVMSGQDNAELWTAEALRTSDRWALIRHLARAALEHMPPCPP